MNCPDCGKPVKNLGVHKRFCKAKQPVVLDDYIQEKPLSSLVAEIREILKAYRYQLEIKTVEVGNKTESAEILARIQLRR